MDDSLVLLSRRLGETLLGQRWQVTTAESCTGGWIAQSITDIPGSSDWFGSGYVTYSNEAKQRMLGVPGSYFAPGAPGAVSRETVTAMAEGALQASGAQFAVATSGIAGPGGGSESKPVGTVWIAWAWRLEAGAPVTVNAQLEHFSGEREAVRRQAVRAALAGLLERIEAQIPA